MLGLDVFCVGGADTNSFCGGCKNIFATMQKGNGCWLHGVASELNVGCVRVNERMVYIKPLDSRKFRALEVGSEDMH